MRIPIRNEHQNALYFADNQIVFVKNKQDIIYMVRKLREEYGKTISKINFEEGGTFSHNTKYYDILSKTGIKAKRIKEKF